MLQDARRLAEPGEWYRDILFLIAPTEDEFQYLREKGIDVEMKVFGYDGLVFLGNEANPANNLTSGQIRSIYSGKIKSWSGIPGGKSADMIVYIRNAESGSQRLFESLVWTGYDMPNFQSLKFREGELDPIVTQREKSITTSDGMEEITRRVMVNQYSIGFNIMSYVNSEFLNPSEDSESKSQAVRTTGDVNLRSGPGLDYKSLGTVSNGVAMNYLGDTSVDDRGVAWYKVQHSSEGVVWVSSRYSNLDSDGDTTANLKLFSVDGYAPTTENFASGLYPFVTTSYVVLRADEPENSHARRLFDWVGTEESRDLISQNSTLSVSFSDSVVLRTDERDPSQSQSLKIAIEQLDKQTMAPQVLKAFSQNELTYLRQGVYALSGKAFHQQKYSAYFQTMSWYKSQGGSDSQIAQRFNDHQRKNLAAITEYQKALIRANANRTSAGNARTLSYAKDQPRVSGEDVPARSHCGRYRAPAPRERRRRVGGSACARRPKLPERQ